MLFPIEHIQATGRTVGQQLGTKTRIGSVTKVPWEHGQLSICGACYLAHQRRPLLDSPCQILELVQPGGPMAAAAAAAAAAAVVVVVVAAAAAAAADAAAAAVVSGTPRLVGPPFVHLVGIYRFAVVPWGQCYKEGSGLLWDCVDVKGMEARVGVKH